MATQNQQLSYMPNTIYFKMPKKTNCSKLFLKYNSNKYDKDFFDRYLNKYVYLPESIVSRARAHADMASSKMTLPILHRKLKIIQTSNLIPDQSQLYIPEWICPKQFQDEDENNVLIDAPFLTDGVWLKTYEKELAKCKKYIPIPPNKQSLQNCSKMFCRRCQRPLREASTIKLGVQLKLLCKHVSNQIWATLQYYGHDFSKGLDICFIDGNIGEGKSTTLAKLENSGHIVAIENLTQFTKTFQTVSGVGMLQAMYTNLERTKFLQNKLNMRMSESIDDCRASNGGADMLQNSNVEEDENNLFELMTLSLNLVIYQFYFATSQCDSILDAIRRRFVLMAKIEKSVYNKKYGGLVLIKEKWLENYHHLENGNGTIFVERSFTNVGSAFMRKEDYMLAPKLVSAFILKRPLPKPTMEKLGGFIADFEIMVDGCIKLNNSMCVLFEDQAKYHRVPQIRDINELLVRIRARGRPAEKDITPEYLTVIAKKLDKFFTTVHHFSRYYYTEHHLQTNCGEIRIFTRLYKQSENIYDIDYVYFVTKYTKENGRPCHILSALDWSSSGV